MKETYPFTNCVIKLQRFIYTKTGHHRIEVIFAAYEIVIKYASALHKFIHRNISNLSSESKNL